MVVSEFGQTETKSGEGVAVSERVESISIDTRIVLFETEKSRFRVTRLHGSEILGVLVGTTYLGFGSDASDLDVAETEVKETIDGFRVLVKASGDADGIFQMHAEQLYTISVWAATSMSQSEPTSACSSSPSTPMSLGLAHLSQPRTLTASLWPCSGSAARRIRGMATCSWRRDLES